MKKVVVVVCIALCAAFLCGGREDKEVPEELPMIIRRMNLLGISEEDFIKAYRQTHATV